MVIMILLIVSDIKKFPCFSQPIAVDDPDGNGYWIMSDAEFLSGSGVH